MKQLETFAGIDWSATSRQAAVVDAGGQLLGEQAFAHSGEGLAAMAGWILELCPEGQAAAAIGKPDGPEVEALLERGIAVFAPDPRQLDRFRDRLSPAGAKDDRRDALVLAGALPADRKAFREVETPPPDVIRLRELSHSESDTAVERTRLINKLKAHPKRCHPGFLDAAPDLGREWALNLWERAPTPDKARSVRKAAVEAVPGESGARADRAEGIIAAFRSRPVPAAPGTVEAVSEAARLIVKKPEACNGDLKSIRKRIKETIKRIKSTDDGRTVEILESVPGIGTAVLAAIIAEAFDSIRRADRQALRCCSGVAPAARRSGQTVLVRRRRAANQRLANAAHHWAMGAVLRDDASKAICRSLRSRGHKHARTLRSVADRMLGVACKMIETGETFDPERRSKNSP